MAKVLNNFLIGVGLDTKDYDKGAKNIQRSLSGMRSLVGVAGAAITGAFAAVGGAAITAGKRIDSLNLEIEKFKTSPQFIYDYRNAIRALGGDAAEAVSAIGAVESALAEYGATGQIRGQEQLVLAGVDTLRLFQADTGEDFLKELARQLEPLSKEQQLIVQETIGLSDAVMRSLRGGTAELERAVERASNLSADFVEATEAAREYSRAVAEIQTRFEGIGNTLAEKLLPSFTSFIDGFGGFIDKHRDKIDTAAEFAGEHGAAAAAIGAGATAAATGAGVQLFGLKSLARTLTRFGGYGIAAGGALFAADMFIKQGVDATDIRSIETGQMTEFQADGIYQPSNSAADYIPDRTIIDNVEASRTSPDVIMLKNAPQSTAPTRLPSINNNIDLNIELDGRELDSRITNVIERREMEMLEDSMSTVDR